MYTDAGKYKMSNFKIDADVENLATDAKMQFNKVVNTSITFRTDTTTSDITNDYTTKTDIGAMAVYCASWNFHKDDNFRVDYSV